jgi:SAM-dependent methyltransferase
MLRHDAPLVWDDRGWAHQVDPTDTIEYDEDYFRRVKAKDNSPICERLHTFRYELLRLTLTKERPLVLDYGCGSLYFLNLLAARTAWHLYGYDVNHKTMVDLIQSKRYNYFKPTYHLALKQNFPFDAVCFFDTLEHLPFPDRVLALCKKWVFLTVPVVKSLKEIKGSKHYLPREHIWYFTSQGVVNFFNSLGFKMVKMSDEEQKIGRTDVMSYVFKRCRT